MPFLCQEAQLGRRRIYSALVQLATYKTAYGSLSKRGREQKASDLLPLLPHFPEDSFSIAPFLSDFLLRSRFYRVIRKVPNISHLHAQKKAIYDILLWNQCEGLAFYFHKGIKKGERIHTLGKGKIKNHSFMRETEEFTTLEVFWNNTGHYPPLIVYDGSEQGRLLGPLLLHEGPFPVVRGFLSLPEIPLPLLAFLPEHPEALGLFGNHNLGSEVPISQGLSYSL